MYSQPGKRKYMTLEEAQMLVLRAGITEVPEKEVTTCFAFSKMTIVNEIENRDNYKNLSFVEFLEFVARLGEYKYKSAPNMSNLAWRSERSYRHV